MKTSTNPLPTGSPAGTSFDVRRWGEMFGTRDYRRFAEEDRHLAAQAEEPLRARLFLKAATWEELAADTRHLRRVRRKTVRAHHPSGQRTARDYP